MKLRILFIMTLCLASGPIASDEMLNLTVTVTGLTPNEGQVVASLYDDKKNYLKKALKIERKKVENSASADLVFNGLPSGEYAVSIYYDLDNDGELDTGMFRIPSEPVGFSNNARGRFGPAKWKKTHFSLDQDLAITVELVNAID